MTVALFPASFDPITCGHIDIASRASRVFDRVLVAVFSHPKKNVLFSVDERIAMAQESLSHLSNVTVESFTGLLVDFARRRGATVAVRGMRTAADFEYEYQQAVLNREMYPDFDVVSFFPAPQYAFVSSSMVKEIAENGGDVRHMVPEPVLRRLAGRFSDVATRTSGG